VGGFLATVFIILVNDSSAKWLSRRNNGIYEPEFRLWLIIPMLIVDIIGFFGFGNATGDGKSPVVASTFDGFVTAAFVISLACSGSYMVDAFRDISVEVFITVVWSKNFLFFGMSFAINPWLTKDGIKPVFDTLGGVQIAICLLALPLFIFGKRNRAFQHKHNLLDRLGLK